MVRILIVNICILIFCSSLQAQAQRLHDSVVLSQIHFHGNKRTRPSVILRELSVAPGDKISSKELTATAELNRKRLINLPLFTEVVVVTDTLNDSTINWTIKVREQWYIWPELTIKLADRNFNVWWQEQNHNLRRINLGVTLKHRNFRGNLEQLSATVQVGYTQRFGMEYFRPYVDKKQKHGIGASFFVSKNEETYYKTDSNKLLFVRTQGNYIIRQAEAAALYVYRPAYATRHSFELRYRNFELDDTVVKLNAEYFDTGRTHMKLMEVTYRHEYNGVDNWNYPLTGIKRVVHVGGRLGFTGMNYQVYTDGELAVFKRPVRKAYISGILRGRLSTPDNVPYYFRSALGAGSEYVRGYEYYVIDGAHYGIARANLKYEALNFTIRNIPISFLAVIPMRFYPKIFADIGYASNKYPGNSYLNNKLLSSWGVGLDFVSTYDFKLRLEYTINHLGEKGVFLHLNSE